MNRRRPDILNRLRDTLHQVWISPHPGPLPSDGSGRLVLRFACYPRLLSAGSIIGTWLFTGPCVIGHCSFLLLVFGFAVLGAEPTVDPKQLPRTAAVEPAQALNTFQVRPGYHLELTAAEPLVESPVAMCFDENGRLFVVEMRDYSERRDERLGRIRMLEDTDGDGRFDKSTVYADNLPWPTAVFCYGGGVFVAATPDILYFKDTDGDGKADVREVVFTGFASDYAPYQTNRLNVQAMLNSFNWGLDNRIHGAASMNGGKIIALRHPEAKPLELRGRDFAIDPRNMTITAEAGGGQHGLSFDDHGRRFACQNSDHIRLYMFDERYGARNPFYTMPQPWTSIAADGPAAEVYRISPDEPWRVLRTKWRVAGTVPGMIEGGGRPSGYFTGATGITIYRGDAFPPEDRGDAFIADCGSNLVHRKKLYPNGVSLLARRAADEEKTEFLASKDLWFRPVQFANAPDGTLYVIDMYREVIEHPWSIPQSIKHHLDLNSGSDRGRIYRIVPAGFKQPKLPQLGKASVPELIATLEHPNGWQRDTAARLLYERLDKGAVPGLKKLAGESKSPLARVQALYALDGLSAVDSGTVLGALRDPDEWVRVHALRLSEGFTQTNPQVVQKILALAADPSIQVRYQAAFSLGELQHPGKGAALAEIARRDVESSWTQAAVLSSASHIEGELFVSLSGLPSFQRDKSAQQFLRQLSILVGARNNSNDVARVLGYCEHTTDAGVSFALLRAVGEGLQRAGSSLVKAANGTDVFSAARRAALADAAPEDVLVEAIELLGQADFETASPVFNSILTQSHGPAAQLAAIRGFGRFNQPQVAAALLQSWPSFTPRVRSEALAVLLARPQRSMLLLKAIEEGTVRSTELSSSQMKFLATHRDAALRQKAAELFQSNALPQGEEMVRSFLPALELNGNAARGRSIFLERCSSCHRLGGEGYAVGPDLASVKTSGREKMLVSILDPNREVQPAYLGYLVETRDDESLVGLIANETATSLIVREAFSRETVVPRSSVKRIQSLGQSLMPEGLEHGLDAQALADLLEYISTAPGP